MFHHTLTVKQNHQRFSGAAGVVFHGTEQRGRNAADPLHVRLARDGCKTGLEWRAAGFCVGSCAAQAFRAMLAVRRERSNWLSAEGPGLVWKFSAFINYAQRTLFYFHR